MSRTDRTSHHLPHRTVFAVTLAMTAVGCSGSTNTATNTPTPATASGTMAGSARTSPFIAGELAATLTADQMSSAHAIAEASMFPSEVLGPEWSLVPPNSYASIPPPPLCDRFNASIYDRSLDPINAYRVFAAPARPNTLLYATIYPSEVVATKYFDDIRQPDYPPCLLQYVDVSLVSPPQRSNSVVGLPLTLRPYGDRILAIQTVSTITSDPAPILGAANPAPASQAPVTLDCVVIQVGKAIVEVDVVPDEHASDDPAGIVDRSLSALVAATKAALAKP
jgi:hypothetical protein